MIVYKLVTDTDDNVVRIHTIDLEDGSFVPEGYSESKPGAISNNKEVYDLTKKGYNSGY